MLGRDYLGKNRAARSKVAQYRSDQSQKERSTSEWRGLRTDLGLLAQRKDYWEDKKPSNSKVTYMAVLGMNDETHWRKEGSINT